MYDNRHARIFKKTTFESKRPVEANYRLLNPEEAEEACLMIKDSVFNSDQMTLYGEEKLNKFLEDLV